MEVRKLLTAAMAVIAICAAMATPAAASEDDNIQGTDLQVNAVAGSPGSDSTSSSMPCYESRGVSVCFHKYGDKIFLKKTIPMDNAKGGFANYLWDGDSWDYYRKGGCWLNSSFGVGQWGYCNFNLYEDSSYNAYGGYGSGLRVYPCPLNTCYSNDYMWVRNDG